jgi:hypothetical protein
MSDDASVAVDPLDMKRERQELRLGDGHPPELPDHDGPPPIPGFGQGAG